MGSHTLLVVSLLWCSLTTRAAPIVRDEDGLTVYTSNGPITGHYAPNATSVIEYLGIPYAQPPTGDLRFAPPERYTGTAPVEAADWVRIVSSDDMFYGAFSADCFLHSDCPHAVSPPSEYPGLLPQAENIPAYFAANNPDTPQSEDCLTLNIWTTATQTKELKPVIIFLYGGRFASGNTNTPMYNGQYFVNNTNAIMVTVNYRTNIFGFPGAPELPSQNFGLRDQRLAIEWVRDNIIAFGGDSSRISLLGQSAGGVAVDWASYAYRYDPIVSGVISHSGNAFSFPLNDLNVTIRNWYNVSSTLGCGSTGDTVECLRGKNWTDIKAAVAKVKAIPGSSPLRSTPQFYPVVDNVTVFDDYLVRTQSGEYATVPYLMGNNHYESGYYKLSAYAAGNNVTEAQSDAFILASFTCPNAFEARSRTSAGHAVWQYRYFGDWENTRLYENSTFSPGGSQAYHGVELHTIFGASEDVTGIPPSDAQRAVTAWMQKAWAAFAADPSNGLLDEEIGWPVFEEGKETLAIIAQNNSAEINYVVPELYDEACAETTLAGLPD